MHKILKPTELSALRRLGYEVFNPPYLSSIYDQSADMRLDYDQPTTLPLDVFNKLMGTNFFYEPINPEIAEILNLYFDTVIVTINGDWLLGILEAFAGTVIYRIYGQPYSLSEHFRRRGSWTKLVTRDNFWIVPFSVECIEREQSWFRALCTDAVPYQIADDTFEWSGKWRVSQHSPEIAVNIPNIANPYYASTYADFAAANTDDYYRIYGPQRDAPDDKRIVGSLSRHELLSRFSRSAGYYYPYSDWVCYLPPIEMMEVGGPVLYMPGSLLASFYDGATPGLVTTRSERKKATKRLLENDAVFIEEVIASQECVRRRYDRAIVRPIFDMTMSKILGEPAQKAHFQFEETVLSGGESRKDTRPRVVVLLHVEGLFQFIHGRAEATEGIPRVVEAIVGSLIDRCGARVSITCVYNDLPVMEEVFHDKIMKGDVELIAIGDGNSTYTLSTLDLVADINARRIDAAAVLIPHYYLFPEFILCKVPTTLYLPDYFPHLMPLEVFDVSAEKDAQNRRIGTTLAKQSARILTNSGYTKSYLGDAGFCAPGQEGKIIVAPLPVLGIGRSSDTIDDERLDLRQTISGRPFVFYPTANRPNKQIAFLLKIFSKLLVKHPDVALVLTCDLSNYAPALHAFNQLKIEKSVILAARLREADLRWCYENALALCITSTAEGNVPPQLLEALNYGCPVISTRLPVIEDCVGELAEHLILCSPLDASEFLRGFEEIVSRRELVLAGQEIVLQRLKWTNSEEAFARRLVAAIPSLMS